LEQVYDIERDAEKVGQGGRDDLVYKNLLADKATADSGDEEDVTKGSSSDVDEGGADLSGSEEDSDDERRFEKGQPRGKKFEDKDKKKVRPVSAILPFLLFILFIFYKKKGFYVNTTQEHKKAVKEEKREKRKEKLPKHIKKKLVGSSSRNKK